METKTTARTWNPGRFINNQCMVVFPNGIAFNITMRSRARVRGRQKIFFPFKTPIDAVKFFQPTYWLVLFKRGDFALIYTWMVDIFLILDK